ncbi:hypothetical protein K402DRAFT_387895 [Aulographum hederae CBS 113979]|uniref:Uncharacterized protein n=1 Tax=Aulographum hederae CBS 113979 TaxID=1176131 RepID=A0A6G1HGD1_9PEZI|nr:hypothetical protein K402DRAFT_387895 [Aulographum hederae CBS 113979]
MASHKADLEDENSRTIRDIGLALHDVGDVFTLTTGSASSSDVQPNITKASMFCFSEYSIGIPPPENPPSYLETLTKSEDVAPWLFNHCIQTHILLFRLMFSHHLNISCLSTPDPTNGYDLGRFARGPIDKVSLALADVATYMNYYCLQHHIGKRLRELFSSLEGLQKAVVQLPLFYIGIASALREPDIYEEAFRVLVEGLDLRDPPATVHYLNDWRDLKLQIYEKRDQQNAALQKLRRDLESLCLTPWASTYECFCGDRVLYDWRSQFPQCPEGAEATLQQPESEEAVHFCARSLFAEWLLLPEPHTTSPEQQFLVKSEKLLNWKRGRRATFKLLGRKSVMVQLEALAARGMKTATAMLLTVMSPLKRVVATAGAT